MWACVCDEAPLFLDASGLIRWMLMVNPERRATLEEIASHWWLNWGYQHPLITENQSAETPPESAPSQPTQTSGATRIADWLRRTSRPLLHSGSKMRCLLRTGGGAVTDTTLMRQRSIRRSRKENNITQSMPESAATCPFTGILKKRGSLKQKLSEPHAPPLEEKSVNPTVVLPSVLPMIPRKGILKKPAEKERESGYYSSSTNSSDSAWTPLEPCAPMPPNRKGILKRNGKFSTADLQEFGSLDQLAASLPSGGARLRSGGAISEDSILSSESFDRLDLPDRHQPAMKLEQPAGGGIGVRACVSADNLLDMESREGFWDADHVRGSMFSITDCGS